jgi:hypothetical protein
MERLFSLQLRFGDMRRVAATMVVVAAVVASSTGRARAAETEPRSVSDETTLKLLAALDQQQMPDVVLWILDRVAADKQAGKALQQEVAFRRASALVGVSQSEGDAEKRAELLDGAQRALDAFLASDPPLERRIDALMQKGGLLIARGRVNLEKAKRPGADAEALRAAAVPFFDGAIASLQGKMAGKKEEITDVSNAEDAVLKALREADAELKAASGGDKKDGATGKDGDGDDKPTSRPKKMRSIARMEEDREELRGKLLQVRLLVADAYFDKSQAFPAASQDAKTALQASTDRYAELFKKYPNRGAGLLARCNEGRNYAAAGDYAKALATLGEMLAIEGNGGFFTTLRSKALNASLQCWLAEEKLDALTDAQLRMALAGVPDDQLDADILGMKYHAAVLLQKRAAAIPDADKVKRKPLQRDAGKLATEVAKVGREYATEARDLLAALGSDFDGAIADGASFETLMDQAKLSLTTMQEQRALAKQAADANQKPEAAAATAAGDDARTQAISFLTKALAAGEGEAIDAVNQARYLLTYLFYEAGRWHEAATLGGFLANRYPSSRGSDQAAMIAMASWQQLQKQPDPVWAADARDQCGAAAEAIIRGWPDSKAAGDAAVVAIAAAVEARDPERIAAVVQAVPAKSPRRAEVLMRAGMGLARQLQEARRLEGADRPAENVLTAWKSQAIATLDEGLAAAKGKPPSAVTVSAALARCQLAIDDGAEKDVDRVLQHPDFGPWTVVNGTLPPGVSESLAGSTLTLALRHFIGTQQIDKAEQAMNLLEKQAGTGGEAAAKLTALYLSMGRDLQEQLRALAGEAAAPEQAAKLLAGFETFLDRVADRDKKIASQMWVASTYDALASGEDMGAAVSKPQREKYLAKAAEVYERLLESGAAEVAQYEPTLRIKMAGIYEDRGQWDEARKHVDWFLTDASRQNMIDPQIAAAKLAQAAGEAATDADAAAKSFREAVSGDTSGGRVSWGWGGIANKLVRQAFSGDDERARRAQAQFFDARVNLARARLAWAEKSAANRGKLLEMAFNDVAITYKLYPQLGGAAMRERFDALLKDIQKAQGQPAEGLAAIDAAASGEGT